jgi:hypothetical protein
MGRLIAVLLMVDGISLIGMITATVATWWTARGDPANSISATSY